MSNGQYNCSMYFFFRKKIVSELFVVPRRSGKDLEIPAGSEASWQDRNTKLMEEVWLITYHRNPQPSVLRVITHILGV